MDLGWGGVGWGVILSDQIADSRNATLTSGLGGVGWGVITSDQIADSRNATLTRPVSKYKLQNTTVQFQNATVQFQNTTI